MPLPMSGIISFRDINIELGKDPNSPISLNDSDVRALAGKATGIITFSDFRGKSLYVPGSQDWGSPGTYSWNVPAGITTITAMSVGGGGVGGGGTLFPGNDSAPGAGGGSGYYTNQVLSVVPGESLTIIVGTAGSGGLVGTRTAGNKGGTGGVSKIMRGSTTLSSANGGVGGDGCYGWSGSGIWGKCGQTAALGGSGRYTGNNGGAGNNDINSSYNAGNGAGLGGAGTPNYRGGPGLNGYVGAEQSRNRHNNSWYQNWGAGGGGFAGNGSGTIGGLGGGGGGGSLGGNGGSGGSGYVRITW